MKRIVILIDGTWGKEGAGAITNVAKLDPNNGRGAPIIKPQSDDGETQRVIYHEGVGASTNPLVHWLGGSIGIGLKTIVQDAYASVVKAFEPGDDLILCGFSRGAYAVRALAGMIGASGIRRNDDTAGIDAAWANYRTKPADRPTIAASADIHEHRSIKAIAVWDTVGSYGIPAGFGLDALARYVTWASLGFHDTTLGDNVDVALHAVAIDERRRPFVPTFWTAPKGRPPRGHVEQTWFAGAHGNVGGGEADARLSDVTLLWMIARLEDLTGLAIDHAAALVTSNSGIEGEVYDSTIGWPVDHLAPHLRTILSADAIEHGPFFNRANRDMVNVNERIHWSVMVKRGTRGTVFGKAKAVYEPENVPAVIAPDKIAAITAGEHR